MLERGAARLAALTARITFAEAPPTLARDAAVGAPTRDSVS
jgi:hypothetical protein